MIGHRQIIEARKRGMRPSCVSVMYGEKPPKAIYDWMHPEKQILYNFNPVVYIEEGDIPDVRFLSGTGVFFYCDGISKEARETVKKIIARNPKFLLFRCWKTDHLGLWKDGKWDISEDA